MAKSHTRFENAMNQIEKMTENGDLTKKHSQDLRGYLDEISEFEQMTEKYYSDVGASDDISRNEEEVVAKSMLKAVGAIYSINRMWWKATNNTLKNPVDSNKETADAIKELKKTAFGMFKPAMERVVEAEEEACEETGIGVLGIFEKFDQRLYDGKRLKQLKKVLGQDGSQELYGYAYNMIEEEYRN